MHPSNSSSTQTHASSLDLIRLKLVGASAHVVPDAGSGFEPFDLPPIQKSLCDWLAMAGHDFAQRHQRCVAFLLFIDLKTHYWTCGVPGQRASRDSACWQLSKNDFPDITSSMKVAGSFQMRTLSPGEQPHDTVPVTDGVHFVQVLSQPLPLIWCFMRIENHLLQVPPQAVADDDLERLLKECEKRAERI